MKFPHTNRVPREITERVGDNLKLLEEQVAKINWRLLLKAYASFFSLLLVSIFLLIVVVRAALAIF